MAETMRTPSSAAPAEKRSTTIASVDKALRIIEHMARLDSNGQSLAELADDLSMNKSSLHHTLATLRERDWVEQDQRGYYHLGAASSLVAHWWNSADHLSTALHPTLMRISEEGNELVHLGQMSGRFVVYLDKVEPDRAVRVWSQVGRRVPAATTSLGRAIIGATEGPIDIDAWIGAVEEPKAQLPQRLEDEINRVRIHGYAIEIEENEPGIACVGVPVLISGQPKIAVSVTMPIERCSQERLHDLASLITDSIASANLAEITTLPLRP